VSAPTRSPYNLQRARVAPVGRTGRQGSAWAKLAGRPPTLLVVPSIAPRPTMHLSRERPATSSPLNKWPRPPPPRPHPMFLAKLCASAISTPASANRRMEAPSRSRSPLAKPLRQSRAAAGPRFRVLALGGGVPGDSY
jgi:hypothetical protein